jgi:hypothetical protein
VFVGEDQLVPPENARDDDHITLHCCGSTAGSDTATEV